MALVTQTFVGKKNELMHKLSFRLLESIQDCFLLQMLDIPTRSSTLLDLLLTNQEGLLDNISTSGTFSYSDNHIVGFKIPLSTPKTSSRTKNLNFRRTNFNILRAPLPGIPCQASMEGKGALKAVSYSRSACCKNILHKGKGRRLNKRPSWLNNELLDVIESKQRSMLSYGKAAK